MKTHLIILAVAFCASYAHSLPYSLNEKIKGLKNEILSFENRPCRTNNHGFKKCNLYYNSSYELKQFDLIKETKNYEEEKTNLEEYIKDKITEGQIFTIRKQYKGKKEYLMLTVKEIYFVPKKNIKGSRLKF